jgi:hypothetical protein
MNSLRTVVGGMQIAWWVIALAVIVFYVTGLVFTVFNPLEMWIFTAVVFALVGGFVHHVWVYSHVLRDDDAPGHEELKRTLNKMREERGF